jgi:prephenate dehydrogenase
MQSVGIVGVGLIGGSFGLALRAAGFTGRIVGVSSPRTIDEAIACGAIDAGVPLDEAASGCDLIYVAQPISTIKDTLVLLGSIASENCLITDVGSTKVEIVETAKRFIMRAQFLGGHPMAGKESRGVASASADLFRGRPYIFTPSEPAQLHTPAASVFISWVERFGANTVTVTPQEHDRAVAFISHLPQLISTGLAACLAERLDNIDNLRLAGPGLTDMSRLAMSSYEIWRDIVDTNTENVGHALSVYIDKLTELRDNLQTHRLGDVFATAAEIAQRIRQQNNNKGQV